MAISFAQLSRAPLVMSLVAFTSHCMSHCTDSDVSTQKKSHKKNLPKTRRQIAFTIYAFKINDVLRRVSRATCSTSSWSTTNLKKFEEAWENCPNGFGEGIRRLSFEGLYQPTSMRMIERFIIPIRFTAKRRRAS